MTGHLGPAFGRPECRRVPGIVEHDALSFAFDPWRVCRI